MYNKKQDIDLIEEINLFRSLKHANIVKIIGWTIWVRKKVFVIELMHTSLQSGKISAMFYI